MSALSEHPAGDHLTALLKALPESAGVYLMKNAAGGVLYVGKAKVLKHRVRSYFQKRDGLTPKTRVLVDKIRDIETVVTAGEVEALVLENNLIKRHKPPYNIMLRDDKQYPYIRLSIHEPFPRFTVVRKVQRDGAKYYGPYVGAGAMRATLKLIHDHFPLADCDITIDGSADRPCLQYQIGRCKAPCTGYQTQDDYRQTVEQVRQFLEGHDKELIATLSERMGQAAEAEHFERAAALRDQIRQIEQTLIKQRITTPGGGEVDVFGLVRTADWVALQVLFVRDGSLVGTRGFVWEDQTGLADAGVLRGAIQQLYAKGLPVPKTLVLPFVLDDAEVFGSWLSDLRGKKCHIETPTRGRGLALLKLADQNAQKSLTDRLNAEQAGERGLLALQKTLGLNTVPHRIEGFDISHISGELTVASMVVWEGAGAKKSDYRQFRIRCTDGPDDFAAMNEVVGRRYQRLVEAGEPLPDLILIDGGKGQLSMAIKALDAVGLRGAARPAILGLAKERGEKFERAFLPGRKNPVALKPGAPATRILQQVRDEAHRFAVTYHRKLRSLTVQDSVLDGIEGIGKVRKKALLTTFGSVEGLKKASLEALVNAPHMNRVSAEAVWAALQPQVPADLDPTGRTRKVGNLTLTSR